KLVVDLMLKLAFKYDPTCGRCERPLDSPGCFHVATPSTVAKNGVDLPVCRGRHKGGRFGVVQTGDHMSDAIAKIMVEFYLFPRKPIRFHLLYAGGRSRLLESVPTHNASGSGRSQEADRSELAQARTDTRDSTSCEDDGF